MFPTNVLIVYIRGKCTTAQTTYFCGVPKDGGGGGYWAPETINLPLYIYSPVNGKYLILDATFRSTLNLKLPNTLI